MKNLIYSLLLCLPTFLFAQVPIPNGDFEDWSIVDSMETPDLWKVTLGNPEALMYKTTDAFSGSYAVFLSSNAPTGITMLSMTFPIDTFYEKLTGYAHIDSIYLSGELAISVLGKNENQSTPLGFISLKEVTDDYVPFEVLFDLQPIGTPFDSLTVWLMSSAETIPDGVLIGYCNAKVDGLELSPYSPTTPVHDITQRNDIHISPSPAKDHFNISISSKGASQIRIFDTQGRQVFDQRITTQQERIAIEHLSNGLYFVLVRTTEGVLYQQRLVKISG